VLGTSAQGGEQNKEREEGCQSALGDSVRIQAVGLQQWLRTGAGRASNSPAL